jgi:eukaryotic-like serine/threonine-protein kinase
MAADVDRGLAARTVQLPAPDATPPVSSTSRPGTATVPVTPITDGDAGTAVLPAPAAGAPVARAGLDFADNTQIGRFGLIRQIARGGMGQVFLARDTKLGRKVAIKFLLYSDPSLVARFIVEARATAQCTHENIVTIYEVGEHDGLPYMVLEYLEGKTLLEMLGAPMPVRQFAEIMLPIARGLERAHEHGIVHRDLKASNVFVTARGQVKILDFGVARIFETPEQAIERTGSTARLRDGQMANRLDGHDTLTQCGALVGTLPYMSPEQWSGSEVDHLSDLWAAGILFWGALTGDHPIGRVSPEELRERVLDRSTPLPSIATREPAIPRELVAVIDRCLAKDKSRRPSARELGDALQAFLAPRAERVDAAESCPYPGLAAFGEGDAKYFFGRSNEIRTAIAQLDAWPLLAVVGPSGVGKSSFVHAGIVPAIRSSAESWQIRMVRPGRTPLQRLAGLVDDLLPTGRPGAEMLAQLHGSPGSFGELIRRAAVRRGECVMIVVDQLEELFTLCEDVTERQLFLTAMLAAADDASAPVRVVLSMRADFLDRLAVHKQFLAELARGLFFLSAPDDENLREALLRPAELAGYSFEASIVDDMMAAARSRGALPLLSFAASRLWDARDRSRRMMTAAAYEQMGRVGGAFARHADQTAAAIPPGSQPLLRAIMTRLVTPEGTRAVGDRDELLGLAADREEGERILDQLVRARLVHMHTEADQGATVEIVHETLITEWPTLRRWLDDNQALRGFMQEVHQAARTWSARGRPNDLVWRGPTANEALANASRHVLALSAVEREFLAAVRAQTARTRRRKLLLVASVLGVLAIGIAGGTIAFIKVSRANAEAQQRAIDADRERANAQAAEAKVQKQLDEVTAAQAAKDRAEKERRTAEAKAQAAEGKAEVFEGEAKLSRAELERRNVDLKRALAGAEVEKARAVDATEVARKVSAALEVALERERERSRRLELEKKKIYSGVLR